jgi:phosphohistidine phosphatase
MRHAESADVLGVKDHELPITETGQESARKVAEQMQKLGWIPNIVMSSNSLRSKQTFESMKTVIEDLNKADLHFLGSLYTESQLDGHTLPHLWQLLSIEACDDDHSCALCLGHNKGWEEAASSLAMDAVNLDHCDAAFFEADGSTWAELLDPDNLEKWTYCNLVKAAAL